MTDTFRRFDATGGWPTLRRMFQQRLPEETLADLDAAVTLAVDCHGDQTRPAGEPYVEHLLEALTALVDGVGATDRDMLCAAILHDVVEDTPCTLAEVRQRFGERVASLVDWVTKPDSDGRASAEEARADYLTRLRSAPIDAVMVKLADRLSNVQRLDTHPRQAKQRSYYRETVNSILPLAEADPWFEQWYGSWKQEFGYLDGPDVAPDRSSQRPATDGARLSAPQVEP